MKKQIIVLLLLLTGVQAYSQNWVTIAKTAPAYSYSMPVLPSIIDTMNVRIAYLQTDSLAVYEVIEFKDTSLDSTNAAFESASRDGRKNPDR